MLVAGIAWYVSSDNIKMVSECEGSEEPKKAEPLVPGEAWSRDNTST